MSTGCPAAPVNTGSYTLTCDADMGKAGSYPIVAAGGKVPATGSCSEEIDRENGQGQRYLRSQRVRCPCRDGTDVEKFHGTAVNDDSRPVWGKLTPACCQLALGKLRCSAAVTSLHLLITEHFPPQLVKPGLMDTPRIPPELIKEVVTKKKKAMKKYPDLASFRLDLAEQWHPTKNGRLLPQDVTAMSGRKIWWVCPKGHEWQAVISSRSAGCGCPQCNPSTSFAEQALYFYISRSYQAENRYRFMKKELDIYLPEFQIAVEHDGPCHLSKKAQQADAGKDALLRENGVYLIWVKTPFPFSVDEERSIVYYTYDENHREDLERAIGETLRLISRQTMKILNADIDVSRDETAIQDRYKAYESERSIFAKVSEAKAYWDWEQNTLNPLYLTYGSPKRVHWKCSYGHQWSSSAADFSRGGRCPVCSGRRVLAEFNDLASANPALAQEWHPSKNGGLGPDQVTVHCGKRVWWQCAQGHEWQAAVASRSSGTGCAVCSGRRLLAGYNDLATQRPDLSTQWHPSKNGSVRADAVTSMSSFKAWWICKEGHEWQAVVSSRTQGCGCPYCAGKRAFPGFNDLCTTDPKLAAQWHPTRNGPVRPDSVTAHSGKRVWWLCPQGHAWEAAVSCRSQGSGCPYCSGRLAVPGKTDLRTVCPELAEEWHPTQNGDLRPEDFTRASKKEI